MHSCQWFGADHLNIFTGVKIEGILRQAADVDDVECRIREYKQGLFVLQFVLSLSSFGILFTLLHGAKFLHWENLICFAKTTWISVLRNGSTDMYLKLFPVPKIHTSCELLVIVLVKFLLVQCAQRKLNYLVTIVFWPRESWIFSRWRCTYHWWLCQGISLQIPQVKPS